MGSNYAIIDDEADYTEQPGVIKWCLKEDRSLKEVFQTEDDIVTWPDIEIRSVFNRKNQCYSSGFKLHP